MDIDIIVSAFINDEDFSFSSSSSSSSDSDFESLITEITKRRKKHEPLEDTLLEYTEEEFKKQFRMSRRTAHFCIELVTKAKILPEHRFGREKVTPKKGFLVTLWYLANSETFRQVSRRFNIADSCCYIVINKIINFIVSLKTTYIKWPTREEQLKIEMEFEKREGLNGIVGCIGSSHIIINKPKLEEDQEIYCNKEGRHSIILQAVTDNECKFIDVFCGEPGSLPDTNVLEKSPFYTNANENTLELENRCILGDTAHPSLPWLVQSSSRIIIENTFGLLKGRFPRLRHFDNKNINFIANCVVAACTLHNICLTMDGSDGYLL